MNKPLVRTLNRRIPGFRGWVVRGNRFENRTRTVFVARMVLHRSCRLRAATAETFIESVDPFYVCAVVTDQEDATWVLTDFVHVISILFLWTVCEQNKPSFSRYNRCTTE
jgi:hypothetical protein